MFVRFLEIRTFNRCPLCHHYVLSRGICANVNVYETHWYPSQARKSSRESLLSPMRKNSLKDGDGEV